MSPVNRGKSKKRLNIYIGGLIMMAIMFFPSFIQAKEEIGIWKNDYLLGDWRGERSSLEDNGLSFEFVYTFDAASNTSGGIKRDETFLANLDMTATLDTEAAGLWQGGTFFVYVLHNHGDEKFTGEIVGDLQTVSNIEANRSTRLYEIWYEQKFFDDVISLLLGQHDLNSEFNVTEYGGLFINSSFGIQPDISANARPSIFPVASPAVRLKWAPSNAFDFMLGVYDGDPGSQEKNNHGTRWILSRDQGALVIGEAAYHIGREEDNSILTGTYKMGIWHNTGDFDDVADTDASGSAVKRDENYGAYFLFDKMVYRESYDQGLGIFFQIGGVPDNRNEVDFYIGGGIHYHGLISGRDEDDFGIAFAHASISDKLRSAGGRDSVETTVELTYRAQITPWFAVQPDIQYVINPGADPSLKDAVAAMTRIEIIF